MLKPKSPQASFYGSYLYDRIIPQDHLLRKINQVVDFSFVHDLVKDSYAPDFGRPAEDPEFMLRLGQGLGLRGELGVTRPQGHCR
jgi:transposase